MKNRNRDRDDAGSAIARRNQRALFDCRDVGDAIPERQRIQASRFLLAGCALLPFFAGSQEFLKASSNPDRLVAGRFGSTTFQSCRATPSLDPDGLPTFDPKTLQPIGRFVSETGTLHGTLRMETAQGLRVSVPPHCEFFQVLRTLGTQKIHRGPGARRPRETHQTPRARKVLGRGPSSLATWNVSWSMKLGRMGA